MKTITKIACRTMGVIGMSIAAYDATKAANQISREQAEYIEAKYLEKAYFDAKTIDIYSHSSNALRKKTFDLRTINPIPAFYGRIKGWIEGFLKNLGYHLPTVACAALALLSKGTLAKVGGIGVALGVCYDIARNGFGLGKQHPMN